MIKRETIEGRPATVAYVTDDMVPVSRDEATLIKIIFDDGEIRFGVKAERDRLKSQWASTKRRSLSLLQKYDGQPRDHGKFDFGKQGGDDDKEGDGGKGDGAKPPSKFTDARGNSVPYERSPFKHASDPTSASSLLQYEYAVQPTDVYAKVAGSRVQVAAAEAKLAKALDTQKEYKTVPTGRTDAQGKAIFKYDPQRAALHTQIRRKLMPQEKIDAAVPKPGEKPTIYLIGGRGGSGKGGFTEPGGSLEEAMKSAVYINNDDVKEALPEYGGWNAGKLHEEASDIGEAMEAFALENKLNTIIDMTMKSEGSMKKRIEAFKAAGYKISAHYMYASPAEAATRSTGRFVGGNKKNGKGRYVPAGYSLADSITNENTFDTFRDQMDYWEVYDNMVPMGEKPKFYSRGGKK